MLAYRLSQNCSVVMLLCGAHILVSMDASLPRNRSVWEGSYGLGWMLPSPDIHRAGCC